MYTKVNFETIDPSNNKVLSRISLTFNDREEAVEFIEAQTLSEYCKVELEFCIDGYEYINATKLVNHLSEEQIDLVRRTMRDYRRGWFSLNDCEEELKTLSLTYDDGCAIVEYFRTKNSTFVEL